MPKTTRSVCLEPMCARVVSSTETREWCTCGRWRVGGEIELKPPSVHVEVDWDKAHVQLTGAGFLTWQRRSKG